MAPEVVVMLRIVGFVGGPGKVEGSGVRWKTMEGFVGCSTISAADHFVSPVSDDAWQVYRPESEVRKSALSGSRKVGCGGGGKKRRVGVGIGNRGKAKEVQGMGKRKRRKVERKEGRGRWR